MLENETTLILQSVTSQDSTAIGTQIWMQENLKTTKLNDGLSFPNKFASSEWTMMTTADYSWYNDNQADNESCGALYNYYAACTKKPFPVDWHVPSQADLSMFTSFPGDLMRQMVG